MCTRDKRNYQQSSTVCRNIRASKYIGKAWTFCEGIANQWRHSEGFAKLNALYNCTTGPHSIVTSHSWQCSTYVTISREYSWCIRSTHIGIILQYCKHCLQYVSTSYTNGNYSCVSYAASSNLLQLMSSAPLRYASLEVNLVLLLLNGTINRFAPIKHLRSCRLIEYRFLGIISSAKDQVFVSKFFLSSYSYLSTKKWRCMHIYRKKRNMWRSATVQLYRDFDSIEQTITKITKFLHSYVPTLTVVNYTTQLAFRHLLWR